MEIIPGILEKDWSEIEKKIEQVKSFAKTIHIDIIDGKFAENTTFLDPEPFKKYTPEIFFELHMMVENPIAYLDRWAKAGFRRFLGQVERMVDQAEFVAKGQLLGDVGLALDLKTSLSEIKIPLEDLDNILLMSVPAGFSGQNFDQSVIEKLKAVVGKTFVPVEIDGGVNDVNLPRIKEVGAESCVATSFIFEGNPSDNYNKLKALI